MSIHRSLKSSSALERHRNVLTRAERIKILKEEEKWQEGRSVFGLPKVAHRKVSVGGKEKKVAKEGEAVAGAEGATADAAKAAAPAKAAAAAKPAAGKASAGKPAK